MAKLCCFLFRINCRQMYKMKQLLVAKMTFYNLANQHGDDGQIAQMPEEKPMLCHGAMAFFKKIEAAEKRLSPRPPRTLCEFYAPINAVPA